MKTLHSFMLTLTLTALCLSACGRLQAPGTPTAVPPTPTPDPCAPENIEAEINKVHALMRRFDDASVLAANTKLDQLGPAIADLQGIRRDAEDLRVPACLSNLKRLQLTHMNTVIATLIAFMGGTNQDALNQGILLARQQHDAYTLELTRLLGITVVAPPTATAGAQVPPGADTPAPAPVTFTIINPGPNPVNLRVSASLTSESVGLLEVGQSALALGKSETGEWIQVELPGQPGQSGWVYATLVQFNSGDLASLPIVTPAPQ